MPARGEATFTLAHIDLDGFKAVNDREGHRQDDRLLLLCADDWRRDIRAADVLARIGGDEFVLVPPGSDLAAAADGLLRRLQARSPFRGPTAAELRAGEDVEACLVRADAELYAAKARRVRSAPTEDSSRRRALRILTSLDETA